MREGGGYGGRERRESNGDEEQREGGKGERGRGGEKKGREEGMDAWIDGLKDGGREEQEMDV